MFNQFIILEYIFFKNNLLRRGQGVKEPFATLPTTIKCHSTCIEVVDKKHPFGAWQRLLKQDITQKISFKVTQFS